MVCVWWVIGKSVIFDILRVIRSMEKGVVILSWVIGKCVILARWRVEKSIKVFGLCHVGKSVDTPRLKNVVFVICDPGVISLI